MTYPRLGHRLHRSSSHRRVTGSNCSSGAGLNTEVIAPTRTPPPVSRLHSTTCRAGYRSQLGERSIEGSSPDPTMFNSILRYPAQTAPSPSRRSFLRQEETSLTGFERGFALWGTSATLPMAPSTTHSAARDHSNGCTEFEWSNAPLPAEPLVGFRLLGDDLAGPL